ncbi:MAG: hypothetical protein Q8Q23_01865 [bacterium]|nr:hypothetical protein [bacterium]
MSKLSNSKMVFQVIIATFATLLITAGVVVAATTISNSVTVGADLTVDTDTLYVDSTNDRTGIGTSTIYSTLAINATDGESAVMVASSTSSSAVEEWLEINSAGDLKVDTDTLFVDRSADKVGLSSSTPWGTLSVGTSNATSTISAGYFCMAAQDEAGNLIYITLNIANVADSNQVFATSTTSCF